MKRFLKNLVTKNKYLSEDEKISKRSFISFSVFFALQAAGVVGFFKLKNQPPDGGLLGGIQEPLRDGLETNEKIFGGSFNPGKLAKEYSKEEAVQEARVNGNVGIGEDFEAAGWKLNIVKNSGEYLEISLDEIKKLPKTEVIYNFKCIEGWSQVSYWGGVRFSDFIKHFSLQPEAAMKYVGMMTPDEEYYIGIDMPSALHPQTILCYEHNNKPLTPDHGYPLRLIIPVKYGIKSIKRIGSIYFDNEKPSDYWAERGYDYYSGL
jgi:hypothetical protein